MAKPVDFPQSNHTYAKDQPEYLPLPVFHQQDREGTVISCWQLDEAELAEVIRTGGKVWLRQLTFNQALQPVLIEGVVPFTPIPS